MQTPKWIEPSGWDFNCLEEPQLYPSLHLSGCTFSPKRFAEELGIQCAEATEPLSGSPSNAPVFGKAILRPPQEITGYPGLHWISEIVQCLTHKFRKQHGIQDEHLYLTVHYKEECHMIFNGCLLRALAFPAIPFSIACVKIDQLPKIPDKVIRLN